MQHDSASTDLKIFQVSVTVSLAEGVVVCWPPRTPCGVSRASSGRTPGTDASIAATNGTPDDGPASDNTSPPKAGGAHASTATTASASPSGGASASSSSKASPTPTAPQPPLASLSFVKVAHLPPLVLTVVTHPGYPSLAPPRFRLSAPFLSSLAASRLCHQLDAAWSDMGGGAPVVFSWVDALGQAVATTLGDARDLWLVRETQGGAEACGKRKEVGAESVGLREAVQGASGLLHLRADGDGASDGEGDGRGVSWLDGNGTDGSGPSGSGKGGDAGGQGGGARGRDVRVEAWCWDPERCVVDILRHDEQCQLAQFLSEEHQCGVCFMTMPGKQFTRVPGCRHFFCTNCLRQLASIAVQDGALTQCRCPNSNCRSPFPPSLLKDLLLPAQFERWESLTLQRSLDVMSDFVYCPRCKAGTLEDEEHLATCGSCFYAFCGLCRERWHRGSECLTPEVRLQILQERAAGRRAAAEELTAAELAMKNELLALSYVKKEAKRCPACGMAIIKSSGCNKMTCGNCAAYFCYLCGKQVDGYQHYGGECKLFDEEEVRRWNQQMQGGPAGWGHADEDHGGMVWWRGGDMGHAAVKFCPNCRQPNFKEGANNHIRCWACTRHFCAQCNSMVKNTAKHYGKGRCKQHSA
eukprot:jgi/Mesvir1/6947/Mv09097-RA.2